MKNCIHFLLFFVLFINTVLADTFYPISAPFRQNSEEMNSIFDIYSSGEPGCKNYCAPFAETLRFAAIMNRYDFNFPSNGAVRRLWDLYSGLTPTKQHVHLP